MTETVRPTQIFCDFLKKVRDEEPKKEDNDFILEFYQQNPLSKDELIVFYGICVGMSPNLFSEENEYVQKLVNAYKIQPQKDSLKTKLKNL